MPLASHDCIYCSATGWNSSSDQGDLMIRWSYDQWLNGLFVLLSSLTDDLLRCKISSWGWYISAWPQISYDFFFFLSIDITPALQAISFFYGITAQLSCIDNISNPCAISIFHYYTPTYCVKVRNGNINNSLCSFNSNIFMKSRKIKSVRVPLRKSIDFLLIRKKSILLSVKCLINDITNEI